MRDAVRVADYVVAPHLAHRQCVVASGLIVIARGLAALGLGLLAGALMGRVLPVVLLALVAFVGCVVGVNMALDAWVRAEAVVIESGFSSSSADRIVDVVFRDPSTGVVLSQDEVWALPAPPDDPEWPLSVYEEVPVGVPGTRVSEYVALAGGLYGAVAVVAVGVSFVVVDRRRPS